MMQFGIIYRILNTVCYFLIVHRVTCDFLKAYFYDFYESFGEPDCILTKSLIR